MNSSRFSVDLSRSGHPVPLVDGILLHSRYEPVIEGERLADAFLSEHPDARDVIVFGLGFGYHIEPLLRRGIRVIGYEPDTEFLSFLMGMIPKPDFLAAITLESTFPELTRHAGIPVFALPASKRRYESLLARLCDPRQAPGPETEIQYDDIRVLVGFPVYGGSYTTAEYVKRAFEKIGCRTRAFDASIGNDLLQHILNINDNTHKASHTQKLTEILADLFWEEYKSFKPHLCFFLAQAPITAHLLEVLREKTDTTTAMWFVEDATRFGYWREFAPKFDAFFCIQRGELFDELRRIGTPGFDYIPMAAEETTSVILSAEDRRVYGSDISFMGAGYPNRRKLFARLLDYDLKIWGVDWGEQLARVVQNDGRWVSVEETRKIYTASKININLHSSMSDDPVQRGGDFVNPRTFEIAVLGGFQLVDRRSLLPELFVEDEEIACFGSLEELRSKIDYYLARDGERERIARAGRKKALLHHTYILRVRTMLENIRQNCPKFSQSVGKEKTGMAEILTRIGDPELSAFLRGVPPERRNDLEYMSSVIHEEKGPLKRHEAILLALATFTGEG